MNYDNNNRSSWYNSGDESSDPNLWYRSYNSAYPSSPPADSANFTHTNYARSAGISSPYSDTYWTSEGSHGVKKRSCTKILMLSISALILVIASTMIFMGSEKEEAVLPPQLEDPGYESYYDYFDDIYGEDTQKSTTIPTAETGTGVTISLSQTPSGGTLSLQDIYKRVGPAVVAITAETDSGSLYWGTGIVISEDGYIVTNAHIIEGTKSASVTLEDNSEFTAKLVGSDSRSDIAVMKIDAEHLAYAEFGDSSILEVGDAVVAIGNPLGEQLKGTMTDGIISAINRGITYNGHTMTLLQTNAAINEGNSGGPLINMYGQIIGITNMKMMSYYTNIEGIGFAIPTSSMKVVVDELIANGFVAGRPAIGITVGEIPSVAESYYTLPSGLYVSKVDKRSDAYAKGIREGDIITEVNGTAVSTTDDINAIKDSLAVGETMLLTIYRNGETSVVDVVMMDMSQFYN